MKRRSFIKAAAVGGGSTLAAPAISQGLMEWRMVTSWPKGLPGLGTGAERLAANITAMTGGKLAIKVYAANELVPALECFGAVSNGTAQMSHDAAYYHTGKSEGCAFFTAFPFGFTAGEIEGWVKYGNGQKLWDELYAPFGLRGFLAGNTGTQMLGWFKKEIRTLDDLKGLKFRAPGNQGKVLQKLGVTPVTLPGGEIFPALQSGAIDAAEWIGPYNDLALGFYQVCKYYYSHGYHEPGAALQLMINEQAWQSLNPELQAIVRTAAEAANRDMLAEYNARSGPALRSLVENHGVIVRGLPEAVLMACGEKSNEVLNEIYASDTSPDFIVRRIVEDFLAFRADVIPWTRIGEQAYVNARRLPFEFKLKA
ncbi:MAG: TRAP transporter substrate-binding protein DctP [Rhodospirillaceae bacterium]|nr:TRAP transporter substrate-binding protein DctP [Rhodospirillaceae bacterium]